MANRMIRSTTKVPVKNNNGVIIGIAGVCRDITKLKKIENQLRKKSEDLQETNRIARRQAERDSDPIGRTRRPNPESVNDQCRTRPAEPDKR